MKPFWQRRLLVPALVLAAANAIAFFAYTRPRAAFEHNIAARAVVLREEVAGERARVARVRQRAHALEANAADVGRFYEPSGRGTPSSRCRRTSSASGGSWASTIGSRSYTNDTVKGSKGLARFEIVMPVRGATGRSRPSCTGWSRCATS